VDIGKRTPGKNSHPSLIGARYFLSTLDPIKDAAMNRLASDVFTLRGTRALTNDPWVAPPPSSRSPHRRCRLLCSLSLAQCDRVKANVLEFTQCVRPAPFFVSPTCAHNRRSTTDDYRRFGLNLAEVGAESCLEGGGGMNRQYS
jgi:hypothetical protein